jgi:hypothetical protein
MRGAGLGYYTKDELRFIFHKEKEMQTISYDNLLTMFEGCFKAIKEDNKTNDANMLNGIWQLAEDYIQDKYKPDIYWQ